MRVLHAVSIGGANVGTDRLAKPVTSPRTHTAAERNADVAPERNAERDPYAGTFTRTSPSTVVGTDSFARDSSSISCSKPGPRVRAHDGAVHLGVGARCLDVQQRQRSVLCLADRLRSCRG